MTYSFTRGPTEYQYRKDATVNIKEALGFLKDFSTSLVQLDLAAIGTIGLFVGFSDFAQSPILGIGHLNGLAWFVSFAEAACIGLSALAFFTSLYFGLLLLNSLPGAAQRFPTTCQQFKPTCSQLRTNRMGSCSAPASVILQSMRSHVGSNMSF
jgi:hypothetical protein